MQQYEGNPVLFWYVAMRGFMLRLDIFMSLLTVVFAAVFLRFSMGQLISLSAIMGLIVITGITNLTVMHRQVGINERHVLWPFG
jgi:ABC-type transport system involved in cytochrome bd biosynthesis fused ATPase/permease subunit